ncbi:MAG: phosphoribosylformylglycinamidine synthase I [Planctomycetes bacterium]|nr:phosphoribosylformylglycinamidine synthase I [Planctomycetota bacterium]
MKRPKALILRTAGTNCDYETLYAFEKAGAAAERVHVNRIVEDKARLHKYHILALPGGFSYGDDIASGKVLANELICRLADDLCKFIADGKLVLGICNGFQVLAKAGFLPGFNSGQQDATLTYNDSNKFEDRWVYLKTVSSKSAFVKEGDDIYLPVAHGEGKFVARDPSVLERIKANGQVVFRYVDPSGQPAGYPWNPNGSTEHIAGICDPTGRILGLMPHPERHVEPTQHPRWTREGLKPEGDGFRLFRNAVEYCRANL